MTARVMMRSLFFLLLFGSVAPVRADFLDPKLTLHLEPGAGPPSSCDGLPHLACDNSGFPDAEIQGDLNTDYRAWVILAKVDSVGGISEIRFKIEFEAGVVISGWTSCADEAIPQPGWPASGSEIVLRFANDPDCPGPTDGQVPLLSLQARATAPALLRLRPTSGGDIPLTDCSGNSGQLPLDFGLGEVGFGYKLGWDPCTYNPFAHGCGVFFECICCLPPTCRPIAPYYDQRTCVNDGGAVLYQVTSASCEDCPVAVTPTTWGQIKSRFQ